METEAHDNKDGMEEEELNKESTPSRDTSELETLAKENEGLKKEILYQKAEFENYRKRMLREQDQSVKFANEKVFRELLSIVDLLDRGIAHGKKSQGKVGTEQAELAALINGVEMTAKELSQLLNRFGVEFIGVSGEKFDPAKHEAISEIETSAEKVGHVLEVFQRGCALHGRLLSPARVVVGKAKP